MYSTVVLTCFTNMRCIHNTVQQYMAHWLNANRALLVYVPGLLGSCLQKYVDISRPSYSVISKTGRKRRQFDIATRLKFSVNGCRGVHRSCIVGSLLFNLSYLQINLIVLKNM
jgi:hypothetical protein